MLLNVYNQLKNVYNKHCFVLKVRLETVLRSLSADRAVRADRSNKCYKKAKFKASKNKKPTTKVAGFVLKAGLEPARTLLLIGF
jgi:hypothetical protein